MASNPNYVTRDAIQADMQPQEAERDFGQDRRLIVEDTRKFPHNLICFMQMEFEEDDGVKEFSGSGFLCEDFRLLTAAHNIVMIDDNKKVAADSVTFIFGFNGQADLIGKKAFQVEGSAFQIPKDHKEMADRFDIAWINLKEYHESKTAEGVDLEWSIDDLPTKHFITCAIPDNSLSAVTLEGDYNICGNSKFIINRNT